MTLGDCEKALLASAAVVSGGGGDEAEATSSRRSDDRTNDVLWIDAGKADLVNIMRR